MKLINILLVSILIATILSIRFGSKVEQDDKKKGSELTAPKVEEKSDTTISMNKRILKLFEKRECTELDLDDPVALAKQQVFDTISNVPQMKSNPWEYYASDDSHLAYLFDHLDNVLKEEVNKNFEDLWREIKTEEIMKNATSIDPYEIKDLFRGFFAGAAPPSTDEEIATRLQKARKGFNLGKWKDSVTVPMLKAAINQWNWYSEDTQDYEKKLLNKFDFNGDGRLDKKEFILLSIINNEPVYGPNCMKCYSGLFYDKIDPIFYIADCQKSGFASAEDIWNAVNKLQNINTRKLTTCQVKLDLKKYYRTNSCSDFVLRNSGKKQGFVDIDEFRRGILLGYWARNLKSPTDYSKRWIGDRDIECSRIRFFSPINTNTNSEPSQFTG